METAGVGGVSGGVICPEEPLPSPPISLPARESERKSGFSLTFRPAAGPIRRRKEFAFTLIASLVVAASYMYPLYQRRAGGVTTCLFHLLTGKPCPLCGMTRSFAAAARLHLSDAFWFHLLGPFLFVGLLASLSLYAYALMRGLSVELSCERRMRKAGAWFLLGALMTAWVLKLYFFGANV